MIRDFVKKLYTMMGALLIIVGLFGCSHGKITIVESERVTETMVDDIVGIYQTGWSNTTEIDTLYFWEDGSITGNASNIEPDHYELEKIYSISYRGNWHKVKNGYVVNVTKEIYEYPNSEPKWFLEVFVSSDAQLRYSERYLNGELIKEFTALEIKRNDDGAIIRWQRK
ncbi:MAG: hypothetical protein IJU75_02800 [Clostridia bacterium]|nr:hypothetical protein [Clostridia bacterium]